jgi:hypothetical protein
MRSTAPDDEHVPTTPDRDALVPAGAVVHDRQVPVALTPRPVADSIDELLAGVTRREPFRPRDARSPTPFERVEIDGGRYVIKHVHVDHDFAMRASGDVDCLPRRAWETGLMDAAAPWVDHATVAAAYDGRARLGVALLMEDVTADLIPATDDPLPEHVHATLLDSMAGMAAAFWGWRDDLDLLPVHRRWEFFSPRALDAERRLGYPEPVPRIAAEGWTRFAERGPADVVDGVLQLSGDASPLAIALDGSPRTFVHGDWKLGNLGYRTGGRTVLLDWTYVGEGYVCHELAWYLALNRARLPVGHTKETTIADFRAALDRRGVDTGGWWEHQLDVCLLGAVVQFGWEKALGEGAELAWWCERARAGLARL